MLLLSLLLLLLSKLSLSYHKGRVQVFMNIKAVGRPKFVIDPTKKIQVSGTERRPEQQERAITSNTKFKITLEKLAISNIEDAGTMLDKQDPAVTLIINDNKYQTKRIQEGGTKCSFPEVFQDITALYIDDILAEVHNVDANGNSKKLLGTGQIKISDAISRQVLILTIILVLILILILTLILIAPTGQ